MSASIEIKIIIKPSLRKYFEAGIRKDHINFSAEEQLARFLAVLLNDTSYPLSSCIAGQQEISLSYRPKAYAEPIF